MGEEDQVYPKLEEPLCLLDTKVEEPSGDSEERESRARSDLPFVEG